MISLERALSDVRQSHVLLYCLGIGSNLSTMKEGSIPMIRLPGGILVPMPGSGRLPGSGFPNYGPEVADMRVLNALASASGAKAWLVSTDSTNVSSIDKVLDEVAAELRSQYTIGYYPDHPANDGRWHQVVVRTKNPRYDVRSRKEYFGGRSGK